MKMYIYCTRKYLCNDLHGFAQYCAPSSDVRYIKLTPKPLGRIMRGMYHIVHSNERRWWELSEHVIGVVQTRKQSLSSFHRIRISAAYLLPRPVLEYLHQLNVVGMRLSTRALRILGSLAHDHSLGRLLPMLHVICEI